jgi:hypothetical protein
MNNYITSENEIERIKRIYINIEKSKNELSMLKEEPSKWETINVILCDNNRMLMKEKIIDFIKRQNDKYIILFTIRGYVEQVTPIIKVTTRVLELISDLFNCRSGYIDPDLDEIYLKIVQCKDKFDFLALYNKTIFIIT